MRFLRGNYFVKKLIPFIGVIIPLKSNTIKNLKNKASDVV